MLAAVFFSAFLGMGGTWPGIWYLWQPALIGLLYLAGQSFILTAVTVGDVSVAAPVASLKVVIVAILLTVLANSAPSRTIWGAACLAATGVFLINYFVPSQGRSHVILTACLAFSGACCFALFDVCIQMFTARWGTGYLAAISYWFVGIFSLGLLPWVDRPADLRQRRWKSLAVGSLLVATQASLLVYSVSTFGNAASINVVYSLRGLWGVIFAWTLANYFGGNELRTPRRTMLFRLAGASLLVTAVIITLLGQ
jgi:drug/metabolite transporter (DMT)-like permease